MKDQFFLVLLLCLLTMLVISSTMILLQRNEVFSNHSDFNREDFVRYYFVPRIKLSVPT